MSPRAVTAPLAPRTATAARPPASSHRAAPLRRPGSGRRRQLRDRLVGHFGHREEGIAESGDRAARPEHRDRREAAGQQPAGRAASPTGAPPPRRRPPGGPGGGQREGREEQEGVEQVGRHHQPAGDRGVVGHQLEAHQAGADQRLDDRQDQAGERREGYPVAGAEAAPGPDRQDHHKGPEEPAGQPVAELDQGLHGRRPRDHLAVAQRPVVAAAGARAGGPDEGPPYRHQDGVGEDGPGEAGEAAMGHGRGTGAERAPPRATPTSGASFPASRAAPSRPGLTASRAGSQPRSELIR